MSRKLGCDMCQSKQVVQGKMTLDKQGQQLDPAEDNCSFSEPDSDMLKVEAGGKQQIAGSMLHVEFSVPRIQHV